MNVESILQQFEGRSILVIGDLMLDEYIWGTAERISPEAPVPVVRCEKRTYAPGGAANVVANLAALGASPIICGVVGNDSAGRILIETLESLQVETSGIVRDASRCTTKKTRVIAHQQQVVRIDHECSEPVSPAVQEKMDRFLREQLVRLDGVIFSDYNKGVLADHHLAKWIPAIREQGKIVTAGPKARSLRDYRGATLLSFNRSEAREAVQNLQIDSITDRTNRDGDRRDESAIERIGAYLIEELRCEAIAITRGADGVSLFTAEGGCLHIPGMPVQVFDVAGAGDTFLSAITLALCCGADWETAARIANAAAACVVRKVGVATADRGEIVSLLAETSELCGGQR